MGACASVPKAMRYEAANAPAPEPREEEPSTTTVAEETAREKVECGNDNSQKKVAEVEASKEAIEVESNKSEIEAPTSQKPAAAVEVEEEKTQPAEIKNDD